MRFKEADFVVRIAYFIAVGRLITLLLTHSNQIVTCKPFYLTASHHFSSPIFQTFKCRSLRFDRFPLLYFPAIVFFWSPSSVIFPATASDPTVGMLQIRASTESSSVAKSSQALKWKDETAESYASKRASATKARLQDIDQEMEEFEAKQAARARRNAQLKQLLAETAAQDIVPASLSEHADGMKVTTGVLKVKTTQKKMVSF